jgi:hypothetical protein
VSRREHHGIDPHSAEALGDPPAFVIIVTSDFRVRDKATAIGYSVE